MPTTVIKTEYIERVWAEHKCTNGASTFWACFSVLKNEAGDVKHESSPRGFDWGHSYCSACGEKLPANPEEMSGPPARG